MINFMCIIYILDFEKSRVNIFEIFKMQFDRYTI